MSRQQIPYFQSWCITHAFYIINLRRYKENYITKNYIKKIDKKLYYKKIKFINKKIKYKFTYVSICN